MSEIDEVHAGADGNATLDQSESIANLFGGRNMIGRTLVIYAEGDYDEEPYMPPFYGPDYPMPETYEVKDVNKSEPIGCCVIGRVAPSAL